MVRPFNTHYPTYLTRKRIQTDVKLLFPLTTLSRRLRFLDEKCNVRKWRWKKFSLYLLWLFLINELRKKENVRVWDSLLSSWLHKHFLYFQKVLKRGSKKKETIWRRTEVMYNSWLLKFLSRLSKKREGALFLLQKGICFFYKN